MEGRMYVPPHPDPNLITDEPWEKICQRLTLGYWNNAGIWVPGYQENIRDLREDLNTVVAGLATVNKRSSIEIKWIVRIVALVTAVRFLGIDHVSQLTKLIWP